jgi:hypothetical protein
MVGNDYLARQATSTLPDETTIPSGPTDGFSLIPRKPLVITVSTTNPVYWTPGADAAVSGYVGDGGCIKSKHDGGCLYPTPGVTDETEPDAAFANKTTPQTVFRGGALLAYLYSPATGTWVKTPAYDQFLTPGVTEQTFEIPSITSPVGVGRIAWVPYGCGIPVKMNVLAPTK